MAGNEADGKPGGATDRAEEFMRQALRLARVALKRDEVLVGSIVVYRGRVVGEGIEGVQDEKDLTAHAEIKAIKEACHSLDTFCLRGCELYTTVEPCFMCSFVIRSAGISRVVIGKAVSYIGGVSSRHPIPVDSGIPDWPRPPVIVSGVLEKECKEPFAR